MNEIEKILTKQVDEGKTPAVQYILFDKDSIIYQFQYGLADVKNLVPVNWNTTFHAFSTTKTFTALAILQLAENGKLNISDNAG